MSKLIIADLEHSIDLDREAMRAIVGLGKRQPWQKHYREQNMVRETHFVRASHALQSAWTNARERITVSKARTDVYFARSLRHDKSHSYQ
jgi:hypothetical protein